MLAGLPTADAGRVTVRGGGPPSACSTRATRLDDEQTVEGGGRRADTARSTSGPATPGCGNVIRGLLADNPGGTRRFSMLSVRPRRRRVRARRAARRSKWQVTCCSTSPPTTWTSRGSPGSPGHPSAAGRPKRGRAARHHPRPLVSSTRCAPPPWEVARTGIVEPFRGRFIRRLHPAAGSEAGPGWGPPRPRRSGRTSPARELRLAAPGRPSPPRPSPSSRIDCGPTRWIADVPEDPGQGGVAAVARRRPARARTFVDLLGVSAGYGRHRGAARHRMADRAPAKRTGILRRQTAAGQSPTPPRPDHRRGRAQPAGTVSGAGQDGQDRRAPTQRPSATLGRAT